jgi:hypothetical protein
MESFTSECNIHSSIWEKYIGNINQFRHILAMESYTIEYAIFPQKYEKLGWDGLYSMPVSSVTFTQRVTLAALY